MAKERILITVKTYPTLSRKYGETVCTAGIREDGSWVRLYPVPFRRLDRDDQYKLFDWIECQLQRNRSDPRPETFRPLNQNELRTVEHVGTGKDRKWRERRRLLLETARVYERLSELIDGAKANECSLAVFKPSRVVDFVWEEDTRDWDPKKLDEMRGLTSQYDLFDDNTWRQTFQVIPKLPYDFSYKFEDSDGRSSKLQILEWQLGALYWNCLKSTDGDEQRALQKVRRKYLDEFLKKDLHFFLGTTQQFHFVAPNPWVIIGVFPIPHEHQLDLF
jgi:hypothetical protein